VRDARGEAVTSCFSTAEGYALTARTAVEACLRVERGDVAAGAWTPSQAFGARFLADVDPDLVSGRLTTRIRSEERRAPVHASRG
jgi:short subunit dehydrogenase-like uncharacterized protein